MSNIILVDANYMLKVAMYARENDRRTEEGYYVGGVIGFLDSILSLAERLTAGSCVLLWDGGVSKRRMSRFPEYKSTRWKERAENPDALAFSEAFFEQKKILFDLCTRMRLQWVELGGREADDVIIYLVKLLSDHNIDLSRVYIASGDKDLLQACRLGARVYRVHKKDIVTADNFERKVGVTVDNYILWRSIVGERQRNDVTGVPNVGEKTATMILNQEDVNDFVGVMNYCGRKEASSRERAVIEFFEIICRNIEILDLEREVFSREEGEMLIKRICQPVPHINKAELVKAFAKYDIRIVDLYNFSSYNTQFSFLQPVQV